MPCSLNLVITWTVLIFATTAGTHRHLVTITVEPCVPYAGFFPPNLRVVSRKFEAHLQGVPKKTPSYLWRLITLFWKRASRDSFGILWLWAFKDQEVQDYVKASLRKMRLKVATLSQNLTLLYHRYSPLIKNVLQCSCQAQVPKTWAQLDWGWHYNLIGHIT